MKKKINIKRRPVYHMTQQGLDDLKREEENLIKRRPQVVINMSNAREQGDLSENAGYHAAKEELGKIDSRLRELNYIIRFAQVTTSSGQPQVNMGSTVEIESEVGTNKFTIVSAMEADPTKGKISDSSPIGSALLGKKVGEKVEVEMPAGKTSYKIVEVS